MPARMQDGVARRYRTERIEVTWAPGRCVHATECFGNLPSVFDSVRSPVDQDFQGAAPDLIEDTVSRCPSGALAFRRIDDRVGGIDDQW